ncbi:MAG: hypothetical protein B7733_23345 [Myxococcales bacterium FL481]|nr:MAG: hypothetical protein B7733_23345 [Myxococcales bacterium FL481]
MSLIDPKIRWPAGIVVGFLVVITANVWMITNALRHPSVPAAEDHWNEALQYDRVIADRRSTQQLGWSARVEPCRARPGTACGFEVRLSSANGEPIASAQGTAELERGDTAAADRRLELVEVEPGLYAADWDPASTGDYGLLLQFSHASGPWRQHRRVRVEAPRLARGVPAR